MKKMNGLSVLEALISLALFSFVLLMFEKTEIVASQSYRESYYFSIAIQQWQSMAERLRAVNGRTDIESMVDAWNRENRDVLPNGYGIVSGVFPMYRVTIYWGKRAQPCMTTRQKGFSGCISTALFLSEDSL